MSGPGDMLQRFRHNRGYGVHSPFAYDMVTRALHPRGCAWYGYSDIENALATETNAGVRREARMLLRVAALLKPDSIFLPIGSHPAYHAALGAADSRMRICRHTSRLDDCRMICSNRDFISLDDLCRLIVRPGTSLIVKDLPRGWHEPLFRALPEGVMFIGRHNLLAVNRPEMQKISYTVSLE